MSESYGSKRCMCRLCGKNNLINFVRSVDGFGFVNHASKNPILQKRLTYSYKLALEGDEIYAFSNGDLIIIDYEL